MTLICRRTEYIDSSLRRRRGWFVGTYGRWLCGPFVTRAAGERYIEEIA